MTNPLLVESFSITGHLFYFKTFSSQPEGSHKQIKQVHGKDVLPLNKANEETPADGTEGEAPAEGAEAAAKDGDPAKKDEKGKDASSDKKTEDKKPTEKKPAEKK